MIYTALYAFLFVVALIGAWDLFGPMREAKLRREMRARNLAEQRAWANRVRRR